MIDQIVIDLFADIRIVLIARMIQNEFTNPLSRCEFGSIGFVLN